MTRTMPSHQPTSTSVTKLSAVRTLADRAGVFGGCDIREGVLVCKAANSAAPASYRVFEHEGKIWLSLVMSDRWLSESIETDLVHTGDKLEDLLEEELVELGHTGGTLRFEHFRSDDLLFTFRSPLPPDVAADPSRIATCLLAYEQCFRRLGDMDAGAQDE